MSWYSSPRLGLLGAELDLPGAQVLDIGNDGANVEVEQQNLLGADYKSYLRILAPKITLQMARVSESVMPILRGLSMATKALNFIYNKSLAINYLMATSKTTTSVVIPATSATGITITGVFLQSDTYQTGTNYYTSGSFDSSTGTITLGSALPGANTDVWVSLTFTGLSCFAKITDARPHRGPWAGFWQVTLELTGA